MLKNLHAILVLCLVKLIISQVNLVMSLNHLVMSPVKIEMSLAYLVTSIVTSLKKFLTRAKKIENPMTNRFLVELRSTNWRLDNPTAVMMPNMTQKMPPTMG